MIERYTSFTLIKSCSPDNKSNLDNAIYMSLVYALDINILNPKNNNTMKNTRECNIYTLHTTHTNMSLIKFINNKYLL